MRILFIGDVFGRPGRRAVSALLPGIVESRGIDLVVANGENAAGGIGITEKTGRELLDSGIDVLTGGNHTWQKSEASSFLSECGRALRPANYPPGAPGRGSVVVDARNGERAAVVSLQGRVFMQPIDCPFRVGSDLVDGARRETPVVLVDFHAEATAEKVALGWYLAGKATAVLGTHTHVQTCDERILEGHTAYITDAGMTGPVDSVIGVRRDSSIARFVTQLPQRFEPAGGPTALCGVVIEADASSGAATSIERIVVPGGDAGGV